MGPKQASGRVLPDFAHQLEFSSVSFVPDIEFLEPRNIRSVWKREDRDFTPWLASEEPLARLLGECGIDLGSDSSVRTEVKVPGVDRKLDVLVETENGTRIAIENQYSQSDHDHLTRALAYGVGLSANVIIIVAEDHRPEFREVARYLNAAALAYGNEGIPVFLIRVEVHGTQGSELVHPTFEAVVEPDEWRAAAISAGGSERDGLIYDFHERILPKLRITTGSFQNVRPTANYWKAGSLGVNGLNVYVGGGKTKSTIQIWFSRANAANENHAGIDALQTHQAQLEEALSEYELDWRRAPSTAMVELIMPGVGYATEPTEDELDEIARIAGVMATTAREHKDEIAAAMNEAAP